MDWYGTNDGKILRKMPIAEARHWARDIFESFAFHFLPSPSTSPSCRIATQVTQELFVLSTNHVNSANHSHFSLLQGGVG